MTMTQSRPNGAVAVPAVASDASAIAVLERVIVTGDLGALQPQERVALYARTCESLGLNPLTRPFEYITLNNKLTLYVRKDATDQLRRLYRVSINRLRHDWQTEIGLLTVVAEGSTPDGRADQASGVVNIKGLSGEALANAVMKAETKAKRRLTLSLVGLGFLDESEVEGAAPVDVDPETGEVKPPPVKPSLLEAVQAQQARLAAPIESPAPAAADAEPSGEGVERQLTPTAAAEEPRPAGACADPSPFTDGETCGLAIGHSGNHKSRNRESWSPAR